VVGAAAGVAAPGAAAAVSALRVFEMNDCEWWLAGSAEEVISYNKDHTNQPLIPITIFPGNRMLAVGILTVSNPKKESGLGGDLTLFRDLSLYLLKH